MDSELYPDPHPHRQALDVDPDSPKWCWSDRIHCGIKSTLCEKIMKKHNKWRHITFFSWGSCNLFPWKIPIFESWSQNAIYNTVDGVMQCLTYNALLQKNMHGILYFCSFISNPVVFSMYLLLLLHVCSIRWYQMPIDWE